MHVLILTGGRLDFDFSKKYIEELSYDMLIAVDKGLEYANKLNLQPDWIVGDFDTIDTELLKDYEKRIHDNLLISKIERYPARKDASDTEIAVDKAIECGAKLVTILAGTGSRLDHVMANLNILLQMEKRSISCYLIDENNRIQVLSGDGRKKCEISKENQWGSYVSVIPMSDVVEGLKLEGMEYPMQNGTIQHGSSLTVSNEIKEDVGRISVENGDIWIIESRD